MAVSFTDRDLGKAFPAFLRDVGPEVERHADHFTPDCPHPDWLRVVGERGWVAVTHDARIRYKPNERDAVQEHKVALLVMIGRMRHADLAVGFINTRSRILRFVDKHRPPYIAKVYCASSITESRGKASAGRVEMWWNPSNSGSR